MTRKPDDKPRSHTVIRRSFLTGAAATASAGIMAALAPDQPYAIDPAAERKTFDLKMVTTWPKNFPGLGTGAERFAQKVTAATNGDINITVYAAGELVPALGVFDAVQRGTADLYHGAEYYWQGKDPAFAFFTAVPYGLNADEMVAWVHYGGGQALWDELSGAYGIKPLQATNSGVQMGGWFKNPINSLEDFKGLKVRMPGLGGEVLRRMGAAASTLPGGEIYQALQSGRIDGTEWVGPWNDLAFGFHQIAKYYYYPGFHEPGSVMSVGFNMDVWNAFTPAQRTIIKAVAAAEVSLSLAEFNAENATAFQEILAMPDISVRPFPPEVVLEMARLSDEVVAEAGSGSPLARRIYDSFTTFRDQAIAYNKVSELAFAQDRLLAEEDHLLGSGDS